MWFLGRNHAQTSAIVLLEWERRKAECEPASSPSPSTSVSEQARAFPGPDLFANLRDGLNSVSQCLRGEVSLGSETIECIIVDGSWRDEMRVIK